MIEQERTTLGDTTPQERLEDFLIRKAEAENDDNLCWKTKECLLVPASIGQFTSLRRMELHSSRMARISHEVGRMSTLRRLDTWSLKIGSIPPSIGQLQNLQELVLTGTYELPKEIGNLGNLKKMQLQCSILSTLPSSIGRLRKVEYLKLISCWKLESLPEEIGNMIELKELQATCSMIGSIPKTIGNLRNLERLDLRGSTELKTLPDTIGDLPSLDKLDLSACYSMASIPECIRKLTNLQTLIFTRIGNHLAHKGGPLVDVGNCAPPCLKALDLSFSKIPAMPYSIAKLENLMFLDFYRTEFFRESKLTVVKLLWVLAYCCPFLGHVRVDEGLLDADDKEHLDFQFACNRACFRTGFCRQIACKSSASISTDAERRIVPNLWPLLLSNAPKAFAVYRKNPIETVHLFPSGVPILFGSHIVPWIPRHYDAISRVLFSDRGRESFVAMLLSRA